MKKVLLSVSILALSLSTYAALPPFFQTAKELKAILSSSAVAAKLGSGRAIDSVVRDGANYTVSAGDCAVSVQVTYLPHVSPPRPGFAGPALFELHVDEVNCLP